MVNGVCFQQNYHILNLILPLTPCFNCKGCNYKNRCALPSHVGFNARYLSCMFGNLHKNLHYEIRPLCMPIVSGVNLFHVCFRVCSAIC